MASKKSEIRTSVRDILRDEFVEGVDLEWEDDELDRLIALTLGEIEQKMPNEVKVTVFDALSTVATELSASATSLVVASDDSFPTTFPFYITIEDEVLSVTATPGADTFTVSRAQKGSTAAIHVVGKSVGLTIVTASNSKEIDLSNIGNLIRVWRCEYRIARPSYNPKQFREVERFGDTLTMLMNIVPSDKEEVHLWCDKKHTLTDASSTLKPDHEVVLTQGVAARAAMNRGRELLNALNVGGVNVGPRMTEWGREQLGLYRAALRHHAVKRPSETYPRD